MRVPREAYSEDYKEFRIVVYDSVSDSYLCIVSGASGIRVVEPAPAAFLPGLPPVSKPFQSVQDAVECAKKDINARP